VRTFAREQRAGSTLPRSCTSYGTGLVGLLGFAAGMWMATSYQLPTAVRVLVVITVTSLPMVLWGLLFIVVLLVIVLATLYATWIGISNFSRIAV